MTSRPCAPRLTRPEHTWRRRGGRKAGVVVAYLVGAVAVLGINAAITCGRRRRRPSGHADGLVYRGLG